MGAPRSACVAALPREKILSHTGRTPLGIAVYRFLRAEAQVMTLNLTAGKLWAF
jgi:hypothetical protein